MVNASYGSFLHIIMTNSELTLLADVYTYMEVKVSHKNFKQLQSFATSKPWLCAMGLFIVG